MITTYPIDQTIAMFNNMLSEDRETDTMLLETDINRVSRYANIVMNPYYLGNISVDGLPPT